MKVALRKAAVSVDHDGGIPAEEEVELTRAPWREIVEGSWALVDCFEENGRRYLIARRDERGASTTGHLCARAYQILVQAALGRSNKHIAFELALPVSTVATGLARAMRKLGIRSRVELVGVWPLMDRPTK